MLVCRQRKKVKRYNNHVILISPPIVFFIHTDSVQILFLFVYTSKVYEIDSRHWDGGGGGGGGGINTT